MAPTITIPLTAWLACLFWYVVAVRQVCGYSDRLTQRASLIGLSFLVLHTVATMHFAHGWSLSAAYEFTERTGGVGAGLYVNFAVPILWGLDWYAMRRPLASGVLKWLVKINRLAIAFVVFNATVIFATSGLRYVAGAGFVILGAVWFARKVRAK